jgi:hypothetical protein
LQKSGWQRKQLEKREDFLKVKILERTDKNGIIFRRIQGAEKG